MDYIRKKAVILGGGLAGTVLGAFLENKDGVILEKEARPGGLCSTSCEEGFTCDTGGGHILFSRHEWFAEEIKSALRSTIRKGKRKNKILYKGVYLRYPFENGVYQLSKAERAACFASFLEAYMHQSETSPGTIDEWCAWACGDYIAENYLRPYNRKIWKVPIETLAPGWTGGRVPRPDLSEMVMACAGLSTEGYKEQLYYRYPKKGGIEELVRAYARKNQGEIVCGVTIEKIGKEKEGFSVHTDKGIFYTETLVSTIPLNELAGLYEKTDMRHTAEKLRYNALITVACAVEGAAGSLPTAVYVHDNDALFHRVCFPQAFSKSNCPDNTVLAAAEITTPFRSELWKRDDESIAQEVFQSLIDKGIVPAGPLVYSSIHRHRYAYVVDTFESVDARKDVAEYFQGEGIRLCGRFGTWRYLNMDAVMLDARETAGKLKGK